MGMGLLRKAMTKRAELDLASYDRFFPSQDFMPKGSFGNLIALPLQGELASLGKTVFLDPTTMKPWPDQWAFLSSVCRMSPDAVVAVAELLRDIDTGPTMSLVELAKADGPRTPPVIAQISGQLSLRRAGLPPALVAGLKHLASLANPEFYEKERMRFSQRGNRSPRNRTPTKIIHSESSPRRAPSRVRWIMTCSRLTS